MSCLCERTNATKYKWTRTVFLSVQRSRARRKSRKSSNWRVGNYSVWCFDQREPQYLGGGTGKSYQIITKECEVARSDRIKSAIIIVALDNTKLVTWEDISWKCWVGGGRNQLYDKHQLTVFDNGRAGFLGKYSCMDGTPTLCILSSLSAGEVDHWSPSVRVNLSAPKELGVADAVH